MYVPQCICELVTSSLTLLLSHYVLLKEKTTKHSRESWWEASSLSAKNREFNFVAFPVPAPVCP
jgi:hypothetical protein